MSTIDDGRLAEIRERLAAATPAPWSRFVDEWRPTAPLSVHRIGAGDEDIANVYLTRPADADLIANAPADLADLLAEVERLAGERDAYKRAKAENDERFMLERDEARADRDRLAAENAALRKVAGDQKHCYLPGFPDVALCGATGERLGDTMAEERARGVCSPCHGRAMEVTRRQAAARALRRFADAHRMPLVMFTRDDGSEVTVGDLLREEADRIERSAHVGLRDDHPAAVREWRAEQ